MVLHHIANRAGPVVEASPALNSKIFGHGDLHVLDIVPIPERLHEGIREPEDQHVVHRPLSEVVIDAKDRRLVEDLAEYSIKVFR